MLWKPIVHYSIHKIPPNVLILIHMNLVQIPPFYLTNIILILSSLLRLGLPWGLPTKTMYASLPSPLRVTCTVHIILLHLIIPIIFDEYDHEAPRYVVFSTSLLSRPSQAQTSSPVSYVLTPSAYVSPSMCTHTKQQTGKITNYK